MNNAVINFTCKGKCSNCGQCCSEFLPLTNNEYKNIRNYIKKNKIPMQLHYTKETVSVTCPFRDNDNKKCLIYSVRPMVCQKFICSLIELQVASNKTLTQNRACFNKNFTNVVSWHRLFYNDLEWEKKFWISHCNGNVEEAVQLMKKLKIIEN